MDAKGRELAAFGCLARKLPPTGKLVPPVALGEDTIGVVQEWFKEQFAASTFNTCKHQPLPMMKGAKPMRLLVKEDAVAHAVHKPATIPAHWQQKVQDDIERDIQLGGS